MTYPSLRTPLRPLSRILPARERGENTDVIERENIRARHEAEKEAVRQRAQGRLLVLGIVLFACTALLRSVLARFRQANRLNHAPKMRAHPLSRNAPTLWIARGASWRPIWKPIRFMLKPRI